MVISISALSTAAPVLKDGSADEPIANDKRAKEIIGYGSAAVEKKSSEQRENAVDGGDGSNKDEETNATSSEDDKSEPVMSAQKVEPSERDYETYDSVSNEDQSSENVNGDEEQEGRSVVVPGEDDHYAEYTDASRRRRRAAQKTAEREQRSVGNQPVAMVSENMVAPAAGVGVRQQRAKRELDSETLRELIETARSQPESGVDYSDYGQNVASDGGEYVLEQNPEETAVESQEDLNNDETEELRPWSENQFTEDDRRPKRRDDDEDDEDDEEAYEEVEREVVRELLAEQAAEETRQALLAFLSSNENAQQSVIREPERTYRLRDNNRFDQEEDDDETAYADDDDDGDEEESENEDEEPEEEQQVAAAPEEIDESDERVNDAPFLVDEEPEKLVEKKRFSYPYNYEPYGGRWGALVPGAKREDRDPYDRLYRLAEALSRPTSIGDDEK